MLHTSCRICTFAPTALIGIRLGFTNLTSSHVVTYSDPWRRPYCETLLQYDSNVGRVSYDDVKLVKPNRILCVFPVSHIPICRCHTWLCRAGIGISKYHLAPLTQALEFCLGAVDLVLPGSTGRSAYMDAQNNAAHISARH